MKNKLSVLISGLIIALFLASLASAQNYIFSGDFNGAEFNLDPIIAAHESVESSLQGNSEFAVEFKGAAWCSGADINKDGKVDDRDVSALASNWQRTDCSGADWCSGADINKDGKVDDRDVSALASNWQKSCSGPEGDVFSQYLVSENSVIIEEGQGFFYFIAEIPSGTKEISFLRNSNEVKNIKLSGYAPKIDNFGINVSNVIEVSLQSSDMDDNELFASLYSQKQGSTEWNPVLFEFKINTNFSYIEIPTDQIPGGDTNFKIVVSDYFHQSEQIKSNVFIPNKPPVVFIDYPVNNSVFKENSITIQASAYDLEQEIPEEEHKWYLNGNYAGEGKNLNLNNLEEGDYNLKVIVEDSELMQAEDSASFSIDNSALPTADLGEYKIEFLGFSDSGNEIYSADLNMLNTVSDAICRFEFAAYNFSYNTGDIFTSANSLYPAEFYFEANPVKDHIADVLINCYNEEDYEYSKSININYGTIYENCNGADINRDGEVSIGDFGILGGNWGKKNCIYSNNFCNGADINRDGEVSIGDFGILGGNWGKKNCFG